MVVIWLLLAFMVNWIVFAYVGERTFSMRILGWLGLSMSVMWLAFIGSILVKVYMVLDKI